MRIAKTVSISIPPELLDRVDRFAERNMITRSAALSIIISSSNRLNDEQRPKVVQATLYGAMEGD